MTTLGRTLPASRPATRSLETLAARLAMLEGRRRYALACLLGVVAVGALPPVGAVPLLWPAFVGLLWLLDGARTGRQAFALGWWFGAGFFLAGLYWVGISMLVDPLRFAWLIPFTVGPLVAYMAVYPAVAVWLVRLSGTRGIARVLMLAAAWSAAEWLRGHLLSGFPWNLIGYAWTVAPEPLQLASLVGIHGLSLVTIVVAALPAAGAGGGGRSGRRPWLPFAVSVALAALLWGGGALRLAGASDAEVPGMGLRIVQPDIAQSMKWQPDRIRDNLLETIKLSEGPSEAAVKVVIWPEAAVLYDLAADRDLRTRLGALVPPGGYLLTGTPRREPDAAAPTGNRYYNSLVAIDHEGRIAASYDKAHLVPLGEYVPLRDILPLSKITPGAADFTPGPGARTLDLAGLPPFGVLICYEAIFPDQAADSAHRPRWLVNVTNDAWFGDSSGPYQHLQSARVRAIEQGVPLVRAANTGISALIDPYGRILARLELGARGAIDASLPQATATPPPYARFGDLIFVLVLAATAGLALWLRGAHG